MAAYPRRLHQNELRRASRLVGDSDRFLQSRQLGRRPPHMQTLTKSALILVLLVLFAPARVLAQASVTGTVRDSSGAVLPGVTVEAASAVLIEKTRTAVTDNT